jgi:cytochrome c553
MKKILIIVCSVLFFISCQKNNASIKVEKVDSTATTEKKSFEMYELSEMALLMEQMYVDNQRLKERIEKGEPVGEFPSHFAKIHQAIMTDPSENDAFFKENAQVFLTAQEMIYKEPEKAKEHYSNAIQACISCHEVKCSGPIPRIKKLQLKP